MNEFRRVEVEAPLSCPARRERGADDDAGRDEEPERVDGDGADVELGDLHVRDQSDILTFRFAPRRASCPHAALTSSPRRRRMKHEYPASQRTRWKARTPVRSGGPSALPSMGFIGMRFTLTGIPVSRRATRRASAAVVVLPDDERVLDRDPSPARQRVRAQRGEELGDRVTTVDRHQARARLVRRRVERDGQPDLPRKSSPRRAISGTRPLVETVTRREERPMPSGWVRRRRARAVAS